MTPHETAPLLAKDVKGRTKSRVSILTLATTIALSVGFFLAGSTFPASPPKVDISRIERCAVESLHTDKSFLDGVDPISGDEFAARRDTLAGELATRNVDAFMIPIPSLESQYYLNISTSTPDHSPVVLLVPYKSASPKLALLSTPGYSPSLPDIFDHFIHWDGHSDLAATLRSFGLAPDKRDATIMNCASWPAGTVLGPGITCVPTERVYHIPLVKSPAEQAIIRAVHVSTGTVVRAVRGCLLPGMSAEGVVTVFDGTITAAGLEPVVTNVSSGTSYDDPLIVHIQAAYMGYTARLTRTILIDLPRNGHKTFAAERADIHSSIESALSTLLEAQDAALASMQGQDFAAITHRVPVAQLFGTKGIEAWTYDFGHVLDNGETASVGTQEIGPRAPGTVFSIDTEAVVRGVRVRHGDSFLASEDWDWQALVGRTKGVRDP